ncbi:MAG: metallophosphoesterase, partial [Lachnospiraceae bacterium]|nr:metallophosphoesterase [Lachnospiraceae bacterium]
MNKKLILVILVIIIFCYWQNNYLSESYYTYSGSRIDSALEGLRIVQISDLHNKRFGKEQGRLLDRLRAYAPDMIVLTGDIVDSNRPNIDIAMELIEGAVEIAPVYYITGNHENWLEA